MTLKSYKVNSIHGKEEERKKDEEANENINSLTGRQRKRALVDLIIENEKWKVSKRELLVLLWFSFIGTVMPQTLASHFRPVRAFWRLAYLAFLVILLIQTWLAIKDYCSHPVVVSMALKSPPGAVDFPSVTICNNNIVKKSMISRISYLKELALLDYFVEQKLQMSNQFSSFPETPDSACGPRNLFTCYNGQCISYTWVCNGRFECEDQSDEFQTEEMCEFMNHIAEFENNQTCGPGYFLCPDEVTCAVPCDWKQECVVHKGVDETEFAGCADSCLRNLQATQIGADLMSPNYPSEYLHNLKCEYRIVSPENTFIRLVIKNFSVESHMTCNYDSLRIIDGATVYDPSLKVNGESKICGTLNGSTTLESTKNKVIIFFTTDATESDYGWHLTYQAVPRTANIPPPSRRKRSMPPEPNNLTDYYYDPSYPFANESAQPAPVEFDYFVRFPTNVATNDSSFNEIQKYDWYGLFMASTMPDYSDFASLVKLTPSEIIGNGHQAEDFVVQCVFDGEICGPASFVTIQNRELGNCFAFNSAVNPKTFELETPRNTTLTGSKNGLKLSLFLDKDEYIGILGQNSGVRVTIVDPGESPPMSAQGMFASSGSATIVALKREMIHRKSEPYSTCTDTWPDSLKLTNKTQQFTYTQELCKKLCYVSHLAENCNCSNMPDTPFSSDLVIDERSKTPCDVWDKLYRVCASEITSRLFQGELDCDCPQACTEHVFQSQSSVTDWPTEAYAPHFAALLRKSTSKQVRDFVENAISQSYFEKSGKLSNILRENFARVEIHYVTLDYIQLDELPKYTLVSLFGTLGGNLGLCLGWSIMSLLEVMQWSVTSILVVLSGAPRRHL